jgi:hypothetical protein
MSSILGFGAQRPALFDPNFAFLHSSHYFPDDTRKLTLRSKHTIQLLTTAVAVLPPSCRLTNSSSLSASFASSACRPHYELRFFDLDNVAGSSDALIGAVTLIHPSASVSASAASSTAASASASSASASASAASWPRVTHLDTSLVTITHAYGPHAHGPGTVTGGGSGGSGSSGSSGSSSTTDGTLVVGWSDGAMGFYAIAAWRELRQWAAASAASTTTTKSRLINQQQQQQQQQKEEEEAQPRRAHAPLLTQRNAAQPDLDSSSPFNTRARWASVSRSASASAAAASASSASAGTESASSSSSSSSSPSSSASGSADHQGGGADMHPDPPMMGGASGGHESCIPPFSSRMITRVHVVTEMTAPAPPLHPTAALTASSAAFSFASASAGPDAASATAEHASDTNEPSASASAGPASASAFEADRSVLATSVYAWRAHRVVAAVFAHGLVSITHWNGTVLDRMWMANRTESAFASASSSTGASSSGPSAEPFITAAIVIPAVTGTQQNGQGRFLVATRRGVAIVSMPAPSLARAEFNDAYEALVADDRERKARGGSEMGEWANQ